MSTVAYPHIEIDSQGRLRMAGTGFKVIMLARLHVEGGLSAEELAEQFPQLTPAQIHAGLAHYYDNKVAMDQEIAERNERAEAILKEIGTARTRKTTLFAGSGWAYQAMVMALLAWLAQVVKPGANQRRAGATMRGDRQPRRRWVAFDWVGHAAGRPCFGVRAACTKLHQFARTWENDVVGRVHGGLGRCGCNRD